MITFWEAKTTVIADLLAHPVSLARPVKRSAQALRRNVSGDVGRIDAARALSMASGQVGGKSPGVKFPCRLDPLQRLLEDHGQGVGFLSVEQRVSMAPQTPPSVSASRGPG